MDEWGLVPEDDMFHPPESDDPPPDFDEVSGRHVKAFVDATPILRHSKTMPGTFWGRAAGGLGFRPNVRRMQRFVNLSWLVPQENGYTRAIPLRASKCPECTAELSVAG